MLLLKHVWNVKVLPETLDIGMTNMDQMTHTPLVDYTSLTLTVIKTVNANIPKMRLVLF